MADNLKSDAQFLLQLLEESYNKYHSINYLRIIYNGIIDVFDIHNNSDPLFYYIKRKEDAQIKETEEFMKKYY